MTVSGRAPRASAFFWILAVYTAWHVVWLGALAFDFVTHPLAPEAQFGSVALRLGTGLLIVPLALVVSALVIRRSPGNVVGLCLLLWATTIMGTLVRPDSPLARYDGLVNTGWTGLWLLGLYFPNGRPAFARFERPIHILSAMAVFILAGWSFLQPTISVANSAQPQVTPVPNPLFIPALAPLRPFWNVADALCLAAVILLILPSLITRYRRGDARSRQQILWLAWAYGLLLVFLAPLIATGLLVTGSTATALDRYGLAGTLAIFFFGIYIYLAPYLAVGNAILRYRLYDIDVIIRKTLVYTVLTALLALVYFGGVVLLQRLVGALTGVEQSPLAVAVSTLVIVALFTPLRRRIQDGIDRRFYRRKYDAQQVLAQFAQTARDETDLDALTGELARVVQDTLQPEGVSVWLPDAAPHQGRR